MFKILVADDEQFILKGIVTILQRNLSEPADIIEAKNGFDALEKIKVGHPDLIITDINMPGLNGLEFVRAIKDMQVKAPVIVLSGYESFEYAKDAIALGIKEYILKPVKPEAFVTLVEKYIAKIKAGRQKVYTEIAAKLENRRIIEGVKMKYLMGALKSSSNSEAAGYQQQLRDLNVFFESRLYTCVVFQYDVNVENQDYIDFVVQNILAEYFLDKTDSFLMSVNYDVGYAVAIFKSGKADFTNSQQKALLRSAADLIQKTAKVRVFAGVGDVATDFTQLHRSLRNALSVTEYKIFERRDILCTYEEVESGNPIALNGHLAVSQVLDVWNELNRIYSLGQNKEVVAALKSLYNQVMQYVSKRLSIKEQNVYRDFAVFWTLDEVKREIKGQLERLDEVGEDAVSNAQLMEEILHYVDEHITEELDLSIVAEQFRRSSGYVSFMFRQHTEGGFNSYVTEKRMEIAKKLLKDRKMSIQEVAEACGNFNAKYFAVVFKKNTGMTPREYRES